MTTTPLRLSEPPLIKSTKEKFRSIETGTKSAVQGNATFDQSLQINAPLSAEENHLVVGKNIYKYVLAYHERLIAIV